jgi:hypothetical protein
LISKGVLRENMMPSPTHLGPGPAWTALPEVAYNDGVRLHHHLLDTPLAFGDSAHAQLTQQTFRSFLDTLSPCMTSITT